MHVGIEAVGAKRGGAATVLCAVVAAMVDQPEVTEVTVWTSPRELRSFDLPNGIHAFDRPEAEPAGGRWAWLNRGLADAARECGVHVVLALNAMGTADCPIVNYYQQPLLYDETARDMVDNDTRLRLTAIRALTWRAAREATGHIVQTDWMLGTVSETWGLPATSIDVVAPDTPEWRAGEAAERSDDLLWVGHDLGYKRWPLAQSIHARWRKFAPAAQLQATLENVAGEGVVALGVIARDELQKRYRRAGALLVTSQVESFGLPLLEAMACRCPIVAPDLPWARSVCDNAALYFDPEAPESAVERLRDARSPAMIVDLETRMEQRLETLAQSGGWAAVADRVVRAA